MVGGIFQAAEPWNTAVDTVAKDPQSDAIIGWLVSAGGWGNGNVLQIDTSINIQCADATTPMKPFTLSQGSCSPDCDNVSTFPVPAGGAVEGETGYACNGGGDCHLLVVDKANNKLYEMWQAFYPAAAGQFNSGGGPMIWDLTKAYPPNLRGDGCTSADAGGFPIAAMLFTADEIAAGHIDHAIRFILPNARIRDDATYVHPATHSGVNDHMPVKNPNAPPYGVHFRLNAGYDATKLPAGAQVIAKALKEHRHVPRRRAASRCGRRRPLHHGRWSGPLTSTSGPQDLAAIRVSDFEVVNLGTIVTDRRQLRTAHATRRGQRRLARDARGLPVAPRGAPRPGPRASTDCQFGRWTAGGRPFLARWIRGPLSSAASSRRTDASRVWHGAGDRGRRRARCVSLSTHHAWRSHMIGSRRALRLGSVSSWPRSCPALPRR